MNSPHRPVLLDEALAGLAVKPGGIYIDATYGRGGHSGAILAQLAGTGMLHAFDQDPEACAHAFRTQAANPNFRIHAANFAQIGRVCADEGLVGRIDGVLFDLGVSSPQLDDAARGFSFMREGPLDMRMNPQAGESAAEWLARASDTEIADVLFHLGEERNSRRIARRIVEARAIEPITTTTQLAEIIASAQIGPRQKIHPATRSFQAIRLHINRELDVLSEALQQAAEVLAPGGRLAVISFHSLEDRIVKRFIRDGGTRDQGPGAGESKSASRAKRWAPPAAAADPWSPASGPRPLSMLERLDRVFPSDEETATNPRARSAVLRIAEKRAVEDAR